MIEFKGECGHTIRARDEDTGKVVRCTYCGREALVPHDQHDELDALFDEVERTGVFDKQATRVGQKAHRTRRKVATEPAGAAPFDPFAVALKMTYVAIGIIVVVVIIKFAVPAARDAYEAIKSPTQVTQTKPTTESGNAVAGPSATTGKAGFGLIATRLTPGQSGAYATAVPVAAAIYHQPGHGKIDELLNSPNANKNMMTDKPVRLNAGPHTLALAVRLTDSKLMKLRAFKELRRDIELRRRDETSALREYFVPDGSVAIRLAMIRGQPHIVRFYEIDVFAGVWMPVTALFMPRQMPLVEYMQHLAPRESYRLNLDEVDSEMRYYEISDNDRKFLVDVLKRVGKASYRALGARDRYVLFEIDIETGRPMTKNLPETR